MKGASTSRVESWAQLAALIETCATEKWIFRGEDRCNDALVPKAGRIGRVKGAARKKPYSETHEQKSQGQVLQYSIHFPLITRLTVE